MDPVTKDGFINASRLVVLKPTGVASRSSGLAPAGCDLGDRQAVLRPYRQGLANRCIGPLHVKRLLTLLNQPPL